MMWECFACFCFYKVDLLDIYHITRVLKANAFTGDSWLLELRLDYSLDNELWMLYQRNKQLLTNEVHIKCSKWYCHFVKIVYMCMCKAMKVMKRWSLRQKRICRLLVINMFMNKDINVGSDSNVMKKKHAHKYMYMHMYMYKYMYVKCCAWEQKLWLYYRL